MEKKDKMTNWVILIILLVVFFLFCVFSYKNLQKENLEKKLSIDAENKTLSSNELVIDANNKRNVKVMLIDKETN